MAEALELKLELELELELGGGINGMGIMAQGHRCDLKIFCYNYTTMAIRNINLTVYIEKDEDGVFVGSIPTVPSCYAQGKTQEEMLKNLRSVLNLCLRNNKKNLDSSKFVGIQNLEVSYA